MLPLDGITVVTLEQAVAGPLASRQLADLGARVLKIERVDGGDFARGYDTAVRGMACHFVWLNRSKESVALDVKTPEGREVLAELVATADVFLQNCGPGATERLGLDAATLLARHPAMVVCDMSGYGASGPFADKRAYDLLVQSEAGLVSVTGTAEEPVKTGIPTADIAAGMYAYSSVLAALFQRERTGRGQAVEITMLEALAEWMGHPLYTALFTGTGPARSGLGHPGIVPYEAYRTGDEQLVVLGIQNDREWARLAEQVLGRPELATDPEFATNVARVRNRKRVDEAVGAAIGGFTAAEATRRLEAAGIATARLNPTEDLVTHPQLAARDRWREVDTPVGPVPALRPAATFAGAQPRMDPVPALGEHTTAVLRGLGYEHDRIEGLAARGVIAAPKTGQRAVDTTYG